MIQNSHNTTSRKASARRSDGCDGTTRYRTIRDGVWKASARSDDSYDGCDQNYHRGRKAREHRKEIGAEFTTVREEAKTDINTLLHKTRSEIRKLKANIRALSQKTGGNQQNEKRHLQTARRNQGNKG